MRLGAGEWAVGDQLPTIAQLQDRYHVRALNTIRAAQKVLADEGLIESVAGVGVFVRAIPVIDAAAEELVTHLHLIRDSADRALAAARRPARVVLNRPEHPVEEVWCHQQSWYCRECKEDLGGATRGWVATADFYDQRIEIGHDEDHEVVIYLGLSLLDDQAAAILRERWWEHRAYQQKACSLLLDGDVDAAARPDRRSKPTGYSSSTQTSTAWPSPCTPPINLDTGAERDGSPGAAGDRTVTSTPRRAARRHAGRRLGWRGTPPTTRSWKRANAS